MRITNETDYALRIMRYLACSGERVTDAKTLSETIAVPPRFTLKILRKLMSGKLVRSYKGSSGGYSLALSPSEISMLDIVETIEGPLFITKCLCGDYSCNCSHKPGEDAKPSCDGSPACTADNDANAGTGKESGRCLYHRVFGEINDMINRELQKVTLAMAVADANGIHVDGMNDDSIHAAGAEKH